MANLTETALSAFMAGEPAPSIIDHKLWSTFPSVSSLPQIPPGQLAKFRAYARERKVGCIILAAGQGTRFVSKDPKVVSICNGRPLGSWVIKAAVSHCIPVVVVVGWKAQRVSGDLGKGMGDDEVAFVIQEKQMGTGHAVAVGLTVFGNDWDGDVMVMCGDSPGVDEVLIESLMENFRRRDELGAIILTGSRRAAGKGTAAYGRIVRAGKKGNEAVVDIVEKKQIDRMKVGEKKTYECGADQVVFDKNELDAIDEFNSGIYIARASILRDALMNITASQTKTDPPKYEYYATDFVKGMVRNKVIIQGLKINDKDIWKLEGANTIEELRELEIKLKRRQI